MLIKKRYSSFPGLLPGDNVVSLVKLLTSKDPDGDIAAAVALEGGYNACSNSSQQLRKKRSTENDCGAGFVADVVNGFCYNVLPTSTFIDDGSSKCKNTFEADVLKFENDNQVDGLLGLLHSGEFQADLYNVNSRECKTLFLHLSSWCKVCPAVNFINVFLRAFFVRTSLLAAFLATYQLWHQNFV